ncbi:D-alanyl-D-alanine carboxypeptidase family protein [Levilactobacillus suantsaiihabitans]|uniref:D-alanyl-D-alanine carboxypeptidase n=1 Tax=Levilactobacillus suantsaiihabitans TaxID=2487722 RepID=A0A4Z0JFB5_9LACO|nr:serine hydrolase [Levilactobacillus suantsaiihabitans]TGD20228.1 D-alanyl-D-alanine carboxypeptidase [Levilactobacillus suantsaiihabitans]
MKKSHLNHWALALGALVTLGGVLMPTSLAEAAAYHTVSTKKIKKTAYHKKHSQGAIYNKKHTKKVSNLTTHPHTTWYATKQATLKHGKSKGIYLYVQNSKHSVKGWIWHGYLKRGKAPFVLTKAKAAVAMDAKTGKVVWSKHANTARPIASVSKIMTLYLTLKKIDGKKRNWNHKVKITSRGLVSMSRSADCGGFHFKLNHRYTVKQLYYAAFLDSSNNSAIALGKWVSGSNAKFIRKMNAQAKAWKLGKAHFVSASGLENSDLKRFGYAYGKANANKVSAKDVALIARHLMTSYPRVLTDGKIGSMTVNGQVCYNYNNLLKGRKYYRASLKVDGLKTGYTPLAGYCFVGTGHKRGKHRVITVVLHDINEFTETRSLMDHAYRLSRMSN